MSRRIIHQIYKIYSFYKKNFKIIEYIKKLNMLDIIMFIESNYGINNCILSAFSRQEINRTFYIKCERKLAGVLVYSYIQACVQ